MAEMGVRAWRLPSHNTAGLLAVPFCALPAHCSPSLCNQLLRTHCSHAAGPQVASVDYRQSHLRSLSNLPAGLEAPPRFLERVAVHYARNQLAGLGALPGQVPLILGIWGPKVGLLGYLPT